MLKMLCMDEFNQFFQEEKAYLNLFLEQKQNNFRQL